MKFNYLKLISAFCALVLFVCLPNQALGQGAGSVRFDASVYNVFETDGSVTVTVNRERGSSGAVSVEYNVLDGTATSGADYEGSDGIITWADGEEGGKSININILNDALLEEQENILISLSNPQGGLSVGQLRETAIIIDGAESGSLGFARDSFITSEGDRYVEIMVTRGLGATGAVLVDYEVLGGGNLSEAQIGGVRHSRRLPEGEEYPDITQSKFVPGKRASPGDDFEPTQGTLFFRDNEMSKLFQVDLERNFDREAYPFTMAELVLSNARAADGEPENIQPVLNPDLSSATLRINDVVGGPATDLIWEQEIWPDSTEPDHRRVGFRFGRARYRVSEGDDDFKDGKIESQADKNAGEGTIEIPVYRSYPLDESVEVGYMVGPNRGFLVDDARENWVNEVAKPTPWTGDLSTTEDDWNTGTKYLELPGDEPRISPNALSTRFLRFGDLLQGMHSRQSLPQILLSPGSDLPTPSGDRVYTPSFYNSYSNGPVMRDFHVVTGH